MQLSAQLPSDPERLELGHVRADVTLWRLGNTGRPFVRYLLPISLLVIGAVLLYLACGGIDWKIVARDLRNVGPSVVLILAAPLVGQTLHMLGWRALVERDLRPTLGRAFRIFVAAQAGNEIGASVLGESIKIVAFPRERRTSAIRAVLWDNLTSLVALGMVLLTLIALPLSRSPKVTGCRLAGLVVMAIIVGIGLAWIGRRSRFCERPPFASIAFAFGAHYLGKCWIVAEYALALALVATASWQSSTLLGLASILGASVGAPIPGQIGVTEGALVSVARIAQLSIPTVLSIAVLRRIRGLAWVSLGIAFCFALRTNARSGRFDGTATRYCQY